MSSKGGGSFGAPKPLPGQEGYRMPQTELLEREAKDMEVRLAMLQDRMQKQQLDDAACPKPGGGRWKSARTDKGSVTSYAKDVIENHKKRSDASGGGDPAMRGLASQRRQARQQQSGGGGGGGGGDFRSKDVDHWSVGDVRDWLNAVMLGQYAPIFEQNEINGPILLEISLEDLDYMQVTILGHRKVLLKGIEDLRKNKRVTISLAAAPTAGGGGGGGGDVGKAMGGGALTSQSTEVKLVFRVTKPDTF